MNTLYTACERHKQTREQNHITMRTTDKQPGVKTEMTYDAALAAAAMCAQEICNTRAKELNTLTT